MNHEWDFYKNLTPFQEFSEISDSSNFINIPDSWSVIIADIKGSTQAVLDGRSRDVNLIGAAAITCALNSAGNNEIPFVFGGDGATLLTPSDLLPAIVTELKSLQSLARQSFRLELRVGHITMAELRKHGVNLQVAKYELSPGNFTAHFKGGALVMAEDMIKKGTQSGVTLVNPDGDHRVPQLKGLSCRLMPLENRKGTILALLARPLGQNTDDVLQEVLSGLRQILGGDIQSARPVSLGNLRWKWPPSSLSAEVQTRKSHQAAIGIWLRTLISALSLAFNIPLGPFKPRVYKTELIRNSDFKKFDETLRMVIDCSLEQADAIESFLRNLGDQNKIAFGTHRSEHALMTCMVKSSTSNQHIHFIDGADGGYTLAAVQMKKAISKSQS